MFRNKDMLCYVMLCYVMLFVPDIPSTVSAKELSVSQELGVV